MRVKILKALTIIAIITFILSGCCLDSESYIPMIACGISGAWLVLIVIANTPKGDHYGARKNF